MKNINIIKKEENVLNGYQQTILDAFRIIAALFVMVGHSFSFYQVSVFKNEEHFPFIQNIGVVIFFLLAGFLTAYSLEKKNRDHQYSFKLFFRHKFVRIAREYIPGLMFIAIIDFISIILNKERYAYYGAYNLIQFFSNALMLQNMGPLSLLGRWFIPFGSGQPLWTLSVVWWHYLLYGFLYISIANKEKLTLSKLAVFLIIVFMASDYLITGRGNGLGFVFALGVIGYYCYGLISQSVAFLMFILSCLGYLLYGLIFKEAYSVYSFIMIWLIFCSAIKSGEIRQRYMKRNSILAYISKSTFMLYLIHYSVIDMIFVTDVNCSNSVKFVLGIIISLIISIGAYFIFGEKNMVSPMINNIKRAYQKEG